MPLLPELWVAWQPIVDLRNGTILGHEALIRGPTGTPVAHPEKLFRWAADNGREEELERACRQRALDTARRNWIPGQRVFLNLDGRWLRLPGDWEHPTAASLPLAIEISEQRSVLGQPALLEALARWRSAGHLLVIDDYGTGYAGVVAVLAVQPDINKLDRALIARLDRDARKQAMVAAIRTWTRDNGVQIIAEGIETAGECEVLRDLGCEYGQGFFLGRPTAVLRTEVDWHPVTGKVHLSSPVDATLAFYARAIAGLTVPSYVVDRRRRLVAWNDAAAALLGFRDADLLGRRCSESPLDHRDRGGRRLCVSACPLVQSMALQKAHMSVLSARRQDGSRQVLQVEATPLFDASTDRVVGALEQFRPLTDWPAVPAPGLTARADTTDRHGA